MEAVAMAETLDQKIARMRAANEKAAQRFKEVEEDRKLAEQHGAAIITEPKSQSVKQNDRTKFREINNRKKLERETMNARRNIEQNDWWTKERELNDQKRLERERKAKEDVEARRNRREQEKKNRKKQKQIKST